MLTIKRLAAMSLSVVALATFLSARTVARQASVADTRLQAALTKELVEGNCQEAIPLYRQVLATTGVTRATAEKARQQLDGCLKKTSQPAGPTEHLISTDRTLGGVAAPRWSPDGRFVIGGRLTPSEFEGSGLFLRNVENGYGRPLFGRSKGYTGSYWGFSPDGKRFAALMAEMPPQSEFARVIRGEIPQTSLSMPGVLVVGRVEAGSEPIVVDIPNMPVSSTEGPFMKPVDWSPDGKWLAYAMPISPLRSYEIYGMDLGTGNRRSLGFRSTGSPDLTWSPSSSELLVHVAATATAPGELRVLNLASGEGRSLPIPGAKVGRLRVVRWGKNGEISLRHLDPANPQVEDTLLLDAATGRSRKTCTGQTINLEGAGGLPTATADICREITHDGRHQIVWRHASKQLVVRELATGVERPLTTASGEEYFGILSPDDRLEVFVSNRDGRWGLYAAEIARAPVARPTRLSDFDDVPIFFFRQWTGDGFIASVTRDESNLLRVNVDAASGKTGATERLTQDGSRNHTPAISPDGQRVAYWSRHGSRFGVAVMDSNGSNERLLLESGQDFPGIQPSWKSPSEILFTLPPGDAVTGARWSGVRSLMSLSPTTRLASPIADVAVEMPQFQGRTQYLAATDEIFQLDKDFRTLRARSISNGRTRVIATFAGEAEVDSFLVSPDGNKVAYSLAQRYDNGRACFSKEAKPVVAVDDILTSCEFGVLSVATGERTVLSSTRNPQGLIAWSPDGRFLMHGGGRPQIMDTVTKVSVPLLDPKVSLNWDRTAAWSPDGSFIVLTDRSQHFEWRQWRGVR